jgi:hypothetical protein
MGSAIWWSRAPDSHQPNILLRFFSREKARFRAAVLRVGLGVRGPARYTNYLSKRRSLSEAWETSDLLYKLFPLFDQCLHDLQML